MIMNDAVILEEKTLKSILESTSLHIPDYQRIYCWESEQVTTLLNDIQNIQTSKYYMGNVILHRKGGYDDIVDGQQRLITLAIILHHLQEDVPLLYNDFYSIEAQQHIYDNGQTISRFLNKLSDEQKISFRDNLNKLTFGVLSIDSEHLELAFTFFTNTNSRGKTLTDYDLLKPHHLRYIPSDYEEQQRHLAAQWDKMINKRKIAAARPETRRNADYIHVMELYLFRLRKWSRKNVGKESDRFVYSEFKTANIINEIPAFGERFNYFEPIQGGQHFFEYVEHFMQKFREFTTIQGTNDKREPIENTYKVISSNLTGYSERWYCYVIEALLFNYYLKFGFHYIDEAALAITRYIAQKRFDSKKAYEHKIVEYARDSDIVFMIEQATSPTFFLAEIENRIKHLDLIDSSMTGVRKYFLNACCRISDILSSRCQTQSFKNYFTTRYEFN